MPPRRPRAVGAALSPLSILTTGRPRLVEDRRRAVAIGAIGDDQRLGIGLGAEGAECGLDGEGARALHDDAFIALVAAREIEQALADLGHHAAELDVARAPVGQHRGLDRARGGERARA